MPIGVHAPVSTSVLLYGRVFLVDAARGPSAILPEEHPVVQQ